ncbi:hypothetical protein BRARA_D00786 [Brassica rapa]|uniref:Uncharacterized protein n=1 Tax=Brassica campestris TaxID=3711 RepID=A0A397ZIZ3_BRACM|nr:hypothetical protein BRARA_D00786 [Brassica rapa]
MEEKQKGKSPCITQRQCLRTLAQAEDPWTLSKDVLTLLSYCAPFAIYHQYLQVVSYEESFSMCLVYMSFSIFFVFLWFSVLGFSNKCYNFQINK